MMKAKKLFVLRHGNAQPYGYQRDQDRELTELGVVEVKATAKAFKKKAETLDAVFVSPYLRAQQTAKVFLAELDASVHVETCPLVTPEGQSKDVAQWLDSQPFESILVVTHQPFAHSFVDYLADQPLPIHFAMTTATMASLEGSFFAGACCQFRWWLTPS
ncbi:phosphohistidine phosphatase SixA [Marinomonas algarum]|uniref:Phosphohistidine phosphatase SixA n=1 Tax=Marinomonas algarum TaxID=2883105 RepID=A0A9X1IQ24_9GAMM|nr:phosphohistidine phosphatase SixA [Marinomonas algarum]MCB5161843.1 phosphohistidine phosphatase SixA [Marinomonas algarum]